MAVVTLTRLWLNPVSDLMAGASFALNALEHDPAVTVTVTPYVGGNFRVKRTRGTQRTAKVTLGFCTDADVALLKGWQGVDMCFRDPIEKFFAVYTDSTFTPRFMGNSWTVSFTALEFTFDESAA